MHKAPGNCPVCSGKMEIKVLCCPDCGTSLEGLFSLCKFCQLTEQQLKFIEVFLQSRGNIKEVERALGISYPTVRNRLDEVIAALGYQIDKDQEEIREGQVEILDALEQGEIEADEASRLLKELSSNKTKKS